MQALMYECFLQDVNESKGANAKVPRHLTFTNSLPSSSLRIASFNVHFWKSGYSYLELSENFVEVVSIFAQLNPDIILCQALKLAFSFCPSLC